MKTITVTLYTRAELKARHPEGYARAFAAWQAQQERFGADASEVFDSLKAVIETAGLKLADWDLSADAYRSSLSVSGLGEEAWMLSGPRAMAWLESNLFGKLRKPFDRPALRYKAEKARGRNKPYTLAGWTPDCPLTGVCYDEDFLGSLRDSIRLGTNLGDAFKTLARVYAKLADVLEEDNVSEELFFDSDFDDNEGRYTADGEEVSL